MPNDYPVMEYIQANGNGRLLLIIKDEDIVLPREISFILEIVYRL